MATVRELITRLGFRVDDAGIRKYDRRLRQVRAESERAAQAIGSMFGAFLGGVTLASFSDTADTVQSLEARIAQLVQTTGDSAASFNAVETAATAARQPVREFGDLYVRLANSTRALLPSQEEALRLTSTISKTFVVGALSASEQASAMLQLSQAFNKGKLDGDEFRTVMEAMPGQITRALSKAMGYETLELFYSAREAGELTIDKLVKGFQSLEEDIDRQFMAMPITIGQGLTVVGNRFSRFVARLNRESGAVKTVANGIIGAFDVVERGLDGLVDFFGSSTNAIKGGGLVVASVFGGRAVSMAAGFAKRIIGLFTPVRALLAGLALAGDDFYTWIRGGRSVIGDIAGPLDELAEKYENIARAFENIGNRFDDLKKKATEAVQTVKEAMKIDEKGGVRGIVKQMVESSLKSIDEALAPKAYAPFYTSQGQVYYQIPEMPGPVPPKAPVTPQSNVSRETPSVLPRVERYLESVLRPLSQRVDTALAPRTDVPAAPGSFSVAPRQDISNSGNINVNVTVGPGDDPQKIGNEIGKAVRAKVPFRLGSALDNRMGYVI